MSESFLHESINVLARTPAVLNALLGGLPDPWIHAVEGPGTWSPHAIIGHLNHGERTDWMTRLAIILEYGLNRPFDPFDREAHLKQDDLKTMDELLDEFKYLRTDNLERLQRFGLTGEQLQLQGTHPALGLVTIRQLIATWTAHDLAHIVQISRTMARRYRGEVGPWADYLSVMK